MPFGTRTIAKALAAIMKRLTTILLITTFLACNRTAKVEQIETKSKTSSDKTAFLRGKQLFLTHCYSCHHISTKKIGPPFQRIREDYGVSWALNFIRNSERLIYEEKDTRARYIFSIYNQSMMTAFPNLTDQEIIAILDYVDSHEFNPSMHSHRTATIEEMSELVEEYEKDRKARENQLLEKIRNFKN